MIPDENCPCFTLQLAFKQENFQRGSSQEYLQRCFKVVEPGFINCRLNNILYNIVSTSIQYASDSSIVNPDFLTSVFEEQNLCNELLGFHLYGTGNHGCPPTQQQAWTGLEVAGLIFLLFSSINFRAPSFFSSELKAAEISGKTFSLSAPAARAMICNAASSSVKFSSLLMYSL
ncbi:hypothetical protein [Pseudomonas reinekei]|uniref:Uncharacterized protein n=1 Tax=Pseudomonas reinekei TaxID=395598 RepID=A0A6H9RJA1_PSERE|nr:hypothetical protein [Pseudomonas reinekei]KAB0484527.1 hypothetical protein F7R15_16885 [Pseudomonas reinekei]